MADSKTTKPILLGKFSPLKAGTSLARICAAALPGKYTVAEIAKAAGLPEDKVVRRLRRRFAAHGIGITLVLPPGVPAAHTRRAAACSHHHRPSSVDVNRADLRRATMVVLVPEKRPPHDEALSAERRITFWSRQAYGLGYRCQREDRFSRLQRRAATLNRQLGGEGLSTWADPPPKPKWMRWATYERKFAAWERIVETANRVFIIQAMRIVRQPKVSIRTSPSRRL
jgi:hypothetical protein